MRGFFVGAGDCVEGPVSGTLLVPSVRLLGGVNLALSFASGSMVLHTTQPQSVGLRIPFTRRDFSRLLDWVQCQIAGHGSTLPGGVEARRGSANHRAEG